MKEGEPARDPHYNNSRELSSAEELPEMASQTSHDSNDCDSNNKGHLLDSTIIQSK